MNKHTFKYLLGLSGFALMQSAIQAPISAADEADETVNFEEIIVTASKRSQRLIDVPMAIATISGADLQKRGVDTIQDLSFAVPGLTMREDGPGSYQIFLRGVANAHGGGALTSVYQDEVPMVLTGFDVLPTRTMDLARVEVLKGPQGTLYGQGAVGGAVRYITNRPNLDTFEGRIEGELETVKTGDMGVTLVGVLNVPIVEDRFAVRIAATVKSGGGWQDQPAAGIENGNGEELTNVRVRALWKPSDELEILGTFVSYRAEYELGQGYEQPDRTIFVAIDPSKTLIPKIWDYELYNLEVSYDFGGFELLSSTSYVDHTHQYPFAYFGGPQTIYGGALSGNGNRYNPGSQFSQEVRLTSTGDGPLQWTVGGFYRDMDRSLTALFEFQFGAFIAPEAEFFSSGTAKSIAVFADVSYEITEKLTAGVGVRYFEEDGVAVSNKAPDQVIQEATFDSVDPRFYLSYAAIDDVNIYASAAKGFRSGGFNAAPLPAFDPETLWSYELGVKGSFFDGTLYLDMAGFYTVYSDMLRRGLIFLGGDLGFQSLVSNIGEAEIKGFETSFAWKATSALTISGSATFMSAEVTELDEGTESNNVGDPIDYVPDFSGTLSANYDFNWSDEMPGFARLDFSYRDKMPYVDLTSFPLENTPQFSDSIGLLDARIGLTSGKINVELYAKNLTNVNKYIDPYRAWNNANRTHPRTVGIKVGLDF
ncbi:MAG: TonB-dependent receptor [Kordiimonadaceae bacterium]|nr:TonB-dependent receptor [Kordiimonadaceae bacterium]